jgi:hypothetical protein
MQFLCGCVHIEDIELGVLLQREVVLYHLFYGGKLSSSVFDRQFVDFGYSFTTTYLQKLMQFLCGCVHIEDFELGVLLWCRTVVY